MGLINDLSNKAKDHIGNARKAAEDVMGMERAENVQVSGVDDPSQVSAALREAEEEETEVVEEIKWMEEEIVEALHFDQQELEKLLQTERKRAEREHEASQAMHKVNEQVVSFNQKLSEIVGQLDDRIQGKLEDSGQAQVYRGGDLGQMKTRSGQNWQKVVRDGAENVVATAKRELENVQRIEEQDNELEHEVAEDFKTFKEQWEQTLNLLQQQQNVMEGWEVNDAQLKEMAEEAAKTSGDVQQVKQNLEKLVDKEDSLSQKVSSIFGEAEEEERSIIETVEDELEKMEVLEDQMEQDQRNSIQAAKEIVEAIEGEGGLQNDIDFLRNLMQRDDINFKSSETLRQELQQLEEVVNWVDTVVNESLQVLEDEIEGEEELENRIEASAEEGAEAESAVS